MFTINHKLSLGNKTLSLELFASASKTNDLSFFVNFEALVLSNEIPVNKKWWNFLCFDQSVNQIYDSTKILLYWRDHKLFKRLESLGMVTTWQSVLRNSCFTVIDSTNTLHLKTTTTLVSLSGFYLLCKHMYNDLEYEIIVVFISKMLDGLLQRHINECIAKKINDSNSIIKNLNNVITKQYLETSHLQRQLKLYNAVFVKRQDKKIDTIKKL